MHSSPCTRLIKILSLLLVLAAYPAHSAVMLDAYTAYIGKDDLYNSKGVRLTEAWQVIRQDRANFHKFGTRQYGDESDSFFSSKNNRAIAERMIMRGNIDSSAADSIVRGNVIIYVEIYGYGSQGEYLNITVLQ